MIIVNKNEVIVLMASYSFLFSIVTDSLWFVQGQQEYV